MQRVKAIHSLLSKLESVEKAFIRALTDLKDEERKYNYLLGRKELDISEEIEKVEIDLRKCTSQMAIKRKFVISVLPYRDIPIMNKVCDTRANDFLFG